MTTYTKETALYNTDAIGSDIEAAGDAYKSVITEVGTTGVKVHPSGQSGSGIVDYTLIDDTGMGVYKDGDRVAKFGSTVTLGQSGHARVDISQFGLFAKDYEGNTFVNLSDWRTEYDGDEYFGYLHDDFEVTSGTTTSTVFELRDEMYEFGQVWVYAPNSSTYTAHNDLWYIDGSHLASHHDEIMLTQVPAVGTKFKVIYGTTSDDAKSFTFGSRATTANNELGHLSFVNGKGCVASGHYSHAEGSGTTAGGENSHAEGSGTQATGLNAHAEGYHTKATCVQVQNDFTTKTSHAEGYLTEASGGSSHAEGVETVASRRASHAQNEGTVAASNSQTALGMYNVEDANGAYAVILGNGTSDSARSNAAVIGWDGNYLAQAMAGVIQMFAGSTAPAGWLICDGSAVSRTSYATLYAVIGTTYGTGDGSTTFNLPDLRGRTAIGAGTGTNLTARTLGATGGHESMQSHSHGTGTFRVLSWNNGTATGIVGRSNASMDRTASSGSNFGAATYTITTNTQGSGNAGNMQPFTVVNYIICTGKTS